MVSTNRCIFLVLACFALSLAPAFAQSAHGPTGSAPPLPPPAAPTTQIPKLLQSPDVSDHAIELKLDLLLEPDLKQCDLQQVKGFDEVSNNLRDALRISTATLQAAKAMLAADLKRVRSTFDDPPDYGVTALNDIMNHPLSKRAPEESSAQLGLRSYLASVSDDDCSALNPANPSWTSAETTLGRFCWPTKMVGIKKRNHRIIDKGTLQNGKIYDDTPDADGNPQQKVISEDPKRPFLTTQELMNIYPKASAYLDKRKSALSQNGARVTDLVANIAVTGGLIGIAMFCPPCAPLVGVSLVEEAGVVASAGTAFLATTTSSILKAEGNAMMSSSGSPKVLDQGKATLDNIQAFANPDGLAEKTRVQRLNELFGGNSTEKAAFLEIPSALFPGFEDVKFGMASAKHFPDDISSNLKNLSDQMQDKSVTFNSSRVVESTTAVKNSLEQMDLNLSNMMDFFSGKCQSENQDNWKHYEPEGIVEHGNMDLLLAKVLARQSECIAGDMTMRVQRMDWVSKAAALTSATCQQIVNQAKHKAHHAAPK